MPLNEVMARVITQIINQQQLSGSDVTAIRVMDMQTGETQDVTQRVMTMVKGKGKGTDNNAPTPRARSRSARRTSRTSWTRSRPT